MSVKRKSNWYVYFIAFGITLAFVIVAIFAFRWYLFPEKTESTGLDQNGEPAADFKPTKEHDFSLLAMISESPASNPEVFVMASFDAVESRVTFVPLPNGISLKNNGRTLPNIYAASGGEGVISAVAQETGVLCDCFVKLHKNALISLVSSFGNVDVNVPKTIVIRDGVVSETINSGLKLFTADLFYEYIMKADFGEGELYQFNCTGNIMSEIINQNYRNIDGSLLDAYYGLMTADTDNNISESFYKSRKAAILYAAEYGIYPADYYVPYGEYESDGAFVISESSVITIKQRAGIE